MPRRIEIMLPRMRYFSLSRKGGSEVQFSLALILANDVFIGTEMSRAERNRISLEWLRRAAHAGHIKAAEMLGDTFKYGWFEQRMNMQVAECWYLVKTKKQKSKLCDLL